MALILALDGMNHARQLRVSPLYQMTPPGRDPLPGVCNRVHIQALSPAFVIRPNRKRAAGSANRWMTARPSPDASACSEGVRRRQNERE